MRISDCGSDVCSSDLGQVDGASTTVVREVWITPQATSASAAALDALAAADLVILGPGSLYTSVLAALVVGDLRAALASTTAKVAYVANLRAEQAEAHGYDVAAHIPATSDERRVGKKCVTTVKSCES